MKVGATFVRIALGTVLAFAGASCGGASANQIAAAKNAVYQTEFEVVWNVAHEEFFRRYKGAARAGAGRGSMGSKRMLFDKWGGSKPYHADAIADSETISVEMKVSVARVGAGGGWRVAVAATVIEWLPGMKPVQRQGGDQPPWVQSRVNALSRAIHERLKQYDVTLSK